LPPKAKIRITPEIREIRKGRISAETLVAIGGLTSILAVSQVTILSLYEKFEGLEWIAAGQAKKGKDTKNERYYHWGNARCEHPKFRTTQMTFHGLSDGREQKKNCFLLSAQGNSTRIARKFVLLGHRKKRLPEIIPKADKSRRRGECRKGNRRVTYSHPMC